MGVQPSLNPMTYESTSAIQKDGSEMPIST
jgi:hypothetical protein